MLQLEIIFEDEDILVCHKPQGTATQTKRIGQQDMVSLIANYRVKKGEKPYVGVVHRLDQPVEGVMVFAKNPKAAGELSRQVRERNIGKHYYAISNSKGIEEAGKCPVTLTGYIAFDGRTNVSRMVTEMDPEGKRAELEYTVQKIIDNKVLFDVLLHTGRHHQIRLQMADAGYPLIGDSKYGKMEKKTELGLCSYRLEFIHPTTKKKMDFSIRPQGLVFKKFFCKSDLKVRGF